MPLTQQTHKDLHNITETLDQRIHELQGKQDTALLPEVNSLIALRTSVAGLVDGAA